LFLVFLLFWIPAFAGIQTPLTRRALSWHPADSVAALIKGTTIDGALRLAAKRHESAESFNST